MSTSHDADNNRPTKTRQTAAAAGVWVKPVYLDVSLDAAQREALLTYAEEVEAGDIWVWMAQMCATGHALEVKREDEHLYARATGTPDSVHSGFCLTARASTVQNAWISLMFRHNVVLEGKWPTKSNRPLDL